MSKVIVFIILSLLLGSCASSQGGASLSASSSAETAPSQQESVSASSKSASEETLQSEIEDGYIVLSRYKYSDASHLKTACKAFSEHAPFYLVLQNDETRTNAFTLNGIDNVKNGVIHLQVDSIDGIFGEPITTPQDAGEVTPYITYETYGCTNPESIEYKAVSYGTTIEAYEADQLVAAFHKTPYCPANLELSSYLPEHLLFLEIDD